MASSPATTPLPEGIALTPVDPAFREDPYPILHDLRRRAPIHRDTQLNRWVLTRQALTTWSRDAPLRFRTGYLTAVIVGAAGVEFGGLLSGVAYLLEGLTFRPENIRLDEGIFATAEAYRLVTEEGMPFREAYRKVAERYND